MKRAASPYPPRHGGALDHEPANLYSVTFLLPCLNEAESLEHVIGEIRRSYAAFPEPYEILVADNGSTDGSQEIARAGGARVIDVPRRGYGAALLAGIEAARAEIVVMGDADGSYRFGDALSMIEQIRAGADLVMGDRFAGGIEPGAMPWLHRHIGNPVLSALGRLLFRVPVRDFHSGLRAFRTESVRRLGLRSSGMEFASEMVVFAQARGLRIEQAPVRLAPDLRSRPPHLRTWRDGWRHLRFLFAHSPSWTFLIPATLSGAGALLTAYLSTVGPLDAGGVELSYKTAAVASSLALIASIAAWSFVLARAMVWGAMPERPYSMEIAGVLSLAVGVLGLVILVAQFISWGETGFGAQTIGQNLLAVIWGGLLLMVGGSSFFFSLLLGLVRSRR